MDDTKKLEIKVGIFLAIGILTIMASLFLLGADRALFSKFIRLQARFDQVQGLAKGSIVSLSGLVVGSVDKIEFVPQQNTILATLKIDDIYQSKITKGSTADIRTQGALGDKFVFITPGDPKAPVLNSQDELEVVKSSDIISIMGQRASEAEKVFDILQNLHALTLELTQDHKISKILNSISTTSSNLETVSRESKKLIEGLNAAHLDHSVKGTVDKLDRILNKIDQGQGTLGALINDPSLHDQVSQLLGGSPRKKFFKNIIRTSIESPNNQSQ